MRKFKKLSVMLSLVLCLSMLMSMGTVFAKGNSDVGVPQADVVRSTYGVAVNALSLYNEAVYQYTDVDIAPYISNPALLVYLDNKIDTLQIKSMHSTFDKVNYVDTYSLLSHEIDGNFIKLHIKSVSEYNYADLLDVDSSSSVVAEITVDISTNSIVNWYMQGDMYDEDVIGYDNATLIQSPMNFKSTNTVSDIQNQLNNAFLDYYGSLFNSENIMSENNSSKQEPKAELRAATSLNKAAIVSWANANYYKSLPESGGSSTLYYDFATIAYNYDCTNFVSHALLAGGATKNSSVDTGWFFNSIAMGDRSSSWSGVQNLYTYLTRSSATKGPKGSSQGYSFFLSFFNI